MNSTPGKPDPGNTATEARSLANLNRIIHRTLPQARIEVVEVPNCQGLELGLINADFPLGPLSPETMRAVIHEPAYWAFCWGSGAALAGWLLAHPHLVAGQRVVDLGCGSGVVAIAAAMAGAARVIACDNDPDALAAVRCNAHLNRSRIDQDGLEFVAHAHLLPNDIDMILMADVLYDKSNFALLTLACDLCPNLLVADSRITTLDHPEFSEVANINSLTLPNLGEFDEFRTVRLFARPGHRADRR